MKKLIITLLFFLLSFSWSHAEIEGSDGCTWKVTEETDEYIMESCGTNNARIRQKHSIEMTYVPSKEKLVNPIDKFKKIVITPEGEETEKEIKKIEEDITITEKKVKEIITDKALEEKQIIENGKNEKIINETKDSSTTDIKEEIKKKETLTWQRIYQLLPTLIVQNEKVKAAEKDYEAAVEILKKTYSAYYPQVTITYGHNWEDDRTPSKSNTVGVDSIKNDGKHGYQSSITITQMIWDFGRTNSLIDIERTKAQQTYFHLELAKEDLVMEAISAWLNLIKTYNIHEANKKIEANALKTLSMTIEKVKKGEASKLEQLQIEQQYRTFQTLTMTSQLTFDSAKQRFQNVWRFKPLDIANIPMPISDLLGLIPDSGASVRSNTTLKIADADIEIALGQLRYDDAEFKPRIDGKLSYTEKEGELGGAYNEQKEEWRADITLSWKIFGGFSNVHQKRSDMAKLDSAELRYEDVVRIVNEQFNNAWNNYVLIEKNLKTLKRTTEINKEMYILTLQDFKAGNSPIIAVFGMKTTHIMSEVAYQNAQIDLLVARYQLHKVLGLVDPILN
jgi:adhesin transport system outer membrane protein|tara:strand:+ start:41 stop:1729 length:1689 start_codon:yes stop_codon:yes gene_type:complete